MQIDVEFKKIWGKELFYPISEDALFLTKFTGRPTILKSQLKLCLEMGWNVTVVQSEINIKEYLSRKEG